MKSKHRDVVPRRRDLSIKTRGQLDRMCGIRFDGVPDAYVPWPERSDDWPLPERCPKCGRRLVQYVWSDTEDEDGYVERACAWIFQPLLRVFPSLGFFFHHYQISIGRGTRYTVDFSKALKP